MKFVWAGDREEFNTCLIYTLQNDLDGDTLRLGAVDFFQVYADDELISYGPTRTASGYVRVRELNVSGKKQIKICVLAYNFDCYACDFQKPFFGAEVLKAGQTVYDTENFECFYDQGRLSHVSRFSPQRGGIECFNFANSKLIKLNTYAVESPVEIYDIGDFADYLKLDFTLLESGKFNGFDVVTELPWGNREKYVKKSEQYNIDSDFLCKGFSGYKYCDYKLNEEHSGFLGVKILAKADTEIILVFDELKVDGKWNFRRSACNEFLRVTCPKGEYRYISMEPYALKLLKVIYKGKAEITPFLITLENKNANSAQLSCGEKLQKVYEASRNTFKQNAVDIFTDCPSRERAGWLCDSYFLGKAENYFTGKNVIEKSFLENFLIANTPEIPEKMVPKCFPSEHLNRLYIPNWAMWFILEIDSYYKMTNDGEMVKKAKKKVYDIIDFFSVYTNEYGLLENLESWVFVEWSACNTKEYIAGVNYPSNMLFAYTLLIAGKLYNDNSLILRAYEMQKKILDLSFDGKFFADNSIRVQDVLERQNSHLSETCQYYALFTGLCPNPEFKKNIIENFGVFRTDDYPDVEVSNTLPGYILRFTYLLEQGEYQRVVSEIEEYFYPMAEKTGTLWEHTAPRASCCHGFTSIVAVILNKALSQLEK